MGYEPIQTVSIVDAIFDYKLMNGRAGKHILTIHGNAKAHYIHYVVIKNIGMTYPRGENNK